MGKTKNIQSIERAAAILELFENSNIEKSVKEISASLSLSKSTVFGLINTLAIFWLSSTSKIRKLLNTVLGQSCWRLEVPFRQTIFIKKPQTHIYRSFSFMFQETCLLAVEENGFCSIY